MRKKEKRLLKRLKFITIICFIVLILELIYIGYSLLISKEESLYFDGVNDVEMRGNSFVTVGSNNDNENYYEKAKISKYDKNRQKTFEKLYNVGYNSAFFGISIDNDSMVAVGSFEKSEEEHKQLIREALIVKYDLDGNIIFENDFKVLDNSRFTNVISYEDNYYVTGQSVYKNMRIGSKEGGAILVKYDKEGNLVWSKTYGSNKASVFNDLVIIDNYIYAVGMSDDDIGIICKYDLDGNFINYNDYKYVDEIGFNSIIVDDNMIFVAGANRQSKNDSSAMIVKYDLDLNFIKQITHRDIGSTRYNRLGIDSNNNIIAIGVITKEKKEKNKTADSFNYDGIIGKYTLDLEEKEVVSYGDERDDYFTGLAIFDNYYFVVGYSSYEDGSYLSKFIRYSEALKMLGVD